VRVLAVLLGGKIRGFKTVLFHAQPRSCVTHVFVKNQREPPSPMIEKSNRFGSRHAARHRFARVAHHFMHTNITTMWFERLFNRDAFWCKTKFFFHK